jgi:hypothetical protein
VYPAAHHTGRAPSAPSVANPHEGIRDYRNDFLEKVSSRANPKRKGPIAPTVILCTMRPSPNLVRVDLGYLRGPPRRQVQWFHSNHHLVHAGRLRMRSERVWFALVHWLAMTMSSIRMNTVPVLPVGSTLHSFKCANSCVRPV